MLGLIAGSGLLPKLIIEERLRLQKPLVVIGLEGESEEAVISQVPHHWVPIGAVGSAVKLLKESGVTELVMAGRVTRPKLHKLRPDLTGAKLLARVTALSKSGDDSLLGTVIQFLEEQGFAVIGVQDVLKNVLMPEGVLTKAKPDKREYQDITLGLQLLHHLGQFDVGQAAVVQQGRVIGIEAAEGTEGLISRVTPLLKNGQGGVLVKTKKPGQDARIDLPTIGPDTLRQAIKAGLAGVAVESGQALVVDRENVIKEANAGKLFVVGVRGED